MTAERLVVLLLLLASACLPGLDLDGRLLGYSLLAVERGEPVAGSLLLTMRDGSQRTIDLSSGYLLGTDGHFDRRLMVHHFWLRFSHDGRRASLVCTSTPLVLLAGGCLLLDGLLLLRLMRWRQLRPKNDRDVPSPRATARETADSAPPRP